MDPKTLPLAPGDVIASRYCVDDVIGLGASGAVVAALDLLSGTRVAIKCLLPQHGKTIGLVRRLQREAYVAARLRSKHTVRILDLGMLAPNGVATPGADSEPWRRARGLPYIVMECLTGIDLATLLLQRGPFEPRMAADYIAQVCCALAEAHALGIIHRDIKPGNLFLTRVDALPMIKILDFGIAKFRSPNAAGDDYHLTNHGTLLGTPSYMSPEQIADAGGVDARADIWSLGVTLYRLITGAVPFQGATPVELALSIIREPAAPLRTLSPDVPAGLDAVVQRCLEKEMQARYQDVTALGRALGRFVSRFTWTAECEGPPTVRFLSC